MVFNGEETQYLRSFSCRRRTRRRDTQASTSGHQEAPQRSGQGQDQAASYAEGHARQGAGHACKRGSDNRGGRLLVRLSAATMSSAIWRTAMASTSKSVSHRGDTVEDMAYLGRATRRFLAASLRRCFDTQCRTTRDYFFRAAAMMWPATNSLSCSIMRHRASPDFNDSIVTGVIDQRARDAYVTILSADHRDLQSASRPPGTDRRPRLRVPGA